MLPAPPRDSMSAREAQELLRSVDLPGEQLVMASGRISGECRQYHRGPALAAGIGDPYDQEGRDIDHLNAREGHVGWRLQANRVAWASQQPDRRRDLLAEPGGSLEVTSIVYSSPLRVTAALKFSAASDRRASSSSRSASSSALGSLPPWAG